MSKERTTMLIEVRGKVKYNNGSLPRETSAYPNGEGVYAIEDGDVIVGLVDVTQSTADSGNLLVGQTFYFPLKDLVRNITTEVERGYSNTLRELIEEHEDWLHQKMMASTEKLLRELREFGTNGGKGISEKTLIEVVRMLSGNKNEETK